MKAKKSLGQNFLDNKSILKKIVSFAKLEPEEKIVEIGPGRGSLTQLILEKDCKVIAIEKDRELIGPLSIKFKEEIESKKLKIIEGDILDYELENKNYKLLGNIPYYITGEIFRKFLQNTKNQPSSMVFVVQKEVAERIVAKDKKESVLSISIKAYGETTYGGIVKAENFKPKPKVDSAIIAINKISKNRFIDSGIDEKKFFEILKTGFGHKRKLLANNLKKEYGQEVLDLVKQKRAENLTVDEWLDLVKKITK